MGHQERERAVTPEMKHRRVGSFMRNSAPTATRVVTASHDGTARVWDARYGSADHSVVGRDQSRDRRPRGLLQPRRHPDRHGRLRRYRAACGTPGPVRPSPRRSITAGSLVRARFTSDGSHVLTVSSDSIARLWNVATVGRSAITVELAGGVNQAVFDPRGATVRDRVWRTESPRSGTRRPAGR